ncbi:unnamed protein product, partial [Meganyctiphanes norvegica]
MSVIALHVVMNKVAAEIEGDGQTPLWWASREGHIDIVKLLLANSADVNKSHNNGKLHLYRSRNWRFSQLRFLVHPDLSRIARWTPLHWASCLGHSEVVQLLLA